LGIVRLLTAESVAHREPCLSSDMRTERPASNSGTTGGGKPADNEPDLLAECGKGASPVPYVDERNLHLKRRQRGVVKLAVTPRPKGKVVASTTNPSFGDCFKTPPGVQQATKGY